MLPMRSLGIIWPIVFALGGWQASATGSISGTFKDATGAPLAGVRVGAVAVHRDGATPTDSGIIISLTQTNASGRYVLENIPVDGITSRRGWSHFRLIIQARPISQELQSSLSAQEPRSRVTISRQWLPR